MEKTPSNFAARYAECVLALHAALPSDDGITVMQAVTGICRVIEDLVVLSTSFDTATGDAALAAIGACVETLEDFLGSPYVQARPLVHDGVHAMVTRALTPKDELH